MEWYTVPYVSVGELRLDWREEPGECGVLSVALGTINAQSWLGSPASDGERCEEHPDECYLEGRVALEEALVQVAASLE